jgi:hypothetical protein
VVEYLPIRRGGGWQRWQIRHEVGMDRARRAIKAIYKVLKFFLWDIEKCLLWTVPKYLVVKPLMKSGKWCWERRGRFSAWCKREAQEMPGRAKRLGNRVWKAAKKIPKAVSDGAKAVWKFSTTTLPKVSRESAMWIWVLFTRHIPHMISKVSKWLWEFVTKTLPKAIRELARCIWEFLTKTLPKVSYKSAMWIWELFTKHIPNMISKVSKWLWEFVTQTLLQAIRELARWTWDLITRRIPEAIGIVSKWIWAGLSAVAKIILDLLQKTASLLHTVFAAIFSFFRSLTLRDIWNGFCDILHVIFVTVPQAVWTWIVHFGETTYEVMAKLFGTLGKCVWYAGAGIVWLCMYIPTKIAEILHGVGSSIAAGFHEVRVWFNPKA